jgi:uncharacterized protein YuzE
MKLHYYAETDSLYIALSTKLATQSDEVAAGVVLDSDADGRLVGIDIDNASHKLELHELKAEHIPVPVNAG